MPDQFPMAPAVDPAGSAAAVIAPLFLDVLEAARALGLSRSAIYLLMDDGKLGSVKVGRRRLIPTDAVRSYAAALIAGAV